MVICNTDKGNITASSHGSKWQSTMPSTHLGSTAAAAAAAKVSHGDPSKDRTGPPCRRAAIKQEALRSKNGRDPTHAQDSGGTAPTCHGMAAAGQIQRSLNREAAAAVRSDAGIIRQHQAP